MRALITGWLSLGAVGLVPRGQASTCSASPSYSWLVQIVSSQSYFSSWMKNQDWSTVFSAPSLLVPLSPCWIPFLLLRFDEKKRISKDTFEFCFWPCWALFLLLWFKRANSGLVILIWLQVWEILTSDEAPVNLFFAVPTIYAKVTFGCWEWVYWFLHALFPSWWSIIGRLKWKRVLLWLHWPRTSGFVSGETFLSKRRTP